MSQKRSNILNSNYELHLYVKEIHGGIYSIPIMSFTCIWVKYFINSQYISILCIVTDELSVHIHIKNNVFKPFFFWKPLIATKTTAKHKNTKRKNKINRSNNKLLASLTKFFRSGNWILLRLSNILCIILYILFFLC